MLPKSLKKTLASDKLSAYYVLVDLNNILTDQCITSPVQ